MTHVTCRLAAKNWDQFRNPTLGNRVWATFTFIFTQTHTRLTALFPGLPGWAGTRKVKPIWILLKQETVSGSGISWAICKSAPRSRQVTTPAPHHSVVYRPDALPAAQPTVSKHFIFRREHNRQSGLCNNLVVYRPELVDELAAVVGVADRVWIPLDLEPLQLGTVLRQADDDLVDVDASAQTQKPAVRCPHPENPEHNKARMPVIAASPSADYITLHYSMQYTAWRKTGATNLREPKKRHNYTGSQNYMHRKT